MAEFNKVELLGSAIEIQAERTPEGVLIITPTILTPHLPQPRPSCWSVVNYMGPDAAQLYNAVPASRQPCLAASKRRM